MKPKPSNRKSEIHFNRERWQFEQDGRPVAFAQAFHAWEDVGAFEWSQAAHQEMAANHMAMAKDTPVFLVANLSRFTWGRGPSLKEALKNAEYRKRDKVSVRRIEWTTLPFFLMNEQRKDDPELADVEIGKPIMPWVNGVGDFTYVGRAIKIDVDGKPVDA
jgi:hypothetical protein